MYFKTIVSVSLKLAVCVRLENYVQIQLHYSPRWGGGGRVLPHNTCTGMRSPMGLWFWDPWSHTGYPFSRRFLEWGIIFQTYESHQIISSHLKLFIGNLHKKKTFINEQIQLLHPVLHAVRYCKVVIVRLLYDIMHLIMRAWFCVIRLLICVEAALSYLDV